MIAVTKSTDALLSEAGDVLVIVDVFPLQVDGAGLERGTEGLDDVTYAAWRIRLRQVSVIHFFFSLSTKGDI